MEKTLLFIVIIFGLFIFWPQVAEVSTVDNVSGWAWSNMDDPATAEDESSIGWISFNCIDREAATGKTCLDVSDPAFDPLINLADYGVNISSLTGDFSGFAWSENIGWVDFAPAGPYPGSPTYSAKADLTTGEVSGWARALAYGGGWDGWIKMRCDGAECATSNYGATFNTITGQASGYAWGDMVVGWVSFSGAGYGIGTDPSIFNQAPAAAISCNDAGCSPGSACNGSWIAYTATADPTPCVYIINNDSTDADSTNCPVPCNDDIVSSEWFLKPQGAPDSAYVSVDSCLGICIYTIPSTVSAGDYVIKLLVKDMGGSDETTSDFTVREEVVAGFMCSLDNTPGSWQDCASLSGTVSIGELIYFYDDSSLAEYSIPSAGFITSRLWEINGTTFDAGNNPNPSVNLVGSSNIIRLTVTDSAGRTDYEEHTIGLVALPLPQWQEIPPFIQLQQFLASLLTFFEGIL